MNRLRKLAEGWDYRIDNQGRLCVFNVSRKVAFVCYQQAPTSCFADAEPEEPLRDNDRVVVVIKVPLLTERHGVVVCAFTTSANVLLDGDNFPVNLDFKSLRHERPDERPAEPTPKPPQKDDRIVVKSVCKQPDGLPSHDVVYASQHGTVAWIAGQLAYVQFDNGGTECIWLINLRRERKEERLKVENILGFSGTAVMGDPEPKTLDLVRVVSREPVCIRVKVLEKGLICVSLKVEDD